MDFVLARPSRARRWFQRRRAEYSAGAERPVAGYTAALVTYALSFGGVAAAARAAGRWPPRVSAGERG